MRGFFRIFTFIVLIAYMIVVAVFAYINPTQVSIDLFLLEVSGSMGISMSVAFMLGSVFGLLAGSALWLRTKSSEVSAKRKLAQSEKELEGIRSNVS